MALIIKSLCFCKGQERARSRTSQAKVGSRGICANSPLQRFAPYRLTATVYNADEPRESKQQSIAATAILFAST